ncbi:putative leucine-rich repeat receptor-like protein kinase [Abeliophyllum distichum]|uniref:Leucine-rich repeat receptor-like protein kinase n=1 Tax=Abeliophyllum distichum TaxID=126358 RepID=A0ABD1TKN7_9LAMI
MKMMELSGNQFSGHLPSTIGLSLQNLEELYLGDNTLTGVIPSSITNASILTIISMGPIFLTGVVPNFASIGNFSISLQVFRAFGCHIKGAIPDEIGNLSSLADLYIDSNHLTGFIPRTLGN